MNQEEIDKQAHWSELSIDIQRRIDLMMVLLREALFTVEELDKQGMVEGIKCDRTHHIRDHIKAVLEHSLEYDRMVDEMLDEFGWQ